MQRKLLLWVAVPVVLAAAGGWYYYATRPAPPPAPAPVTPPPLPTTPPPVAAAPASNPVLPTPGPPLPALDASDAPLLGALRDIGGGALAELLRPQDLVRHIVASVDAMPRARLEMEMRPLRRPDGEFLALGPDDGATISPRNAERYTGHVRVLGALDMPQLAALYRYYYPLFQQAYQDLGNPDGHFNDRLIEVIDHLLATPVVDGPIRLVRPKVMYEFADPRLQALSVGQKALLRLDTTQRRTVLAQLRTLRSAVATAAAAQ